MSAAENRIALDVGQVSLSPSPIYSKWVLEGNPIARNKLLSESADGTASSYIWDCTAGRFNWFYEVEETIYVIEGGVVLKDASGVARRLRAGDSIFLSGWRTRGVACRGLYSEVRLDPDTSAAQLGACKARLSVPQAIAWQRRERERGSGHDPKQLARRPSLRPPVWPQIWRHRRIAAGDQNCWQQRPRRNTAPGPTIQNAGSRPAHPPSSARVTAPTHR